jgi:hypothetical protein
MHWVGYDQVYKDGSTQEIDVNQLCNYEELLVVLARMFNLERQFDGKFTSDLEYEDKERGFVPVGICPWEYVALLFLKILVIFLLLLASSSLLETTQLLEIFPKM